MLVRSILCTGLLAVGLAGLVYAQTSQATLVGEVTTRGGLPVAGVRILAERDASGSVEMAVTNAQGQYVLPFLLPGSYTLRIQAAGYRPVLRRGLELHVSQREVADFELQELASDLAGLPSEALSRGSVGLIYGPDAEVRLGIVDDRPPLLTDATSSTVSGIVDELPIRELPLVGRDVYSLFVALPGVTSDNATQRGQGFSVNGFPVSSSNYLLDGVDNNIIRTTSAATIPPPAAIQEYRLSTSNFSAEYGRGAFVANVVTVAGGNRWHGSLFEFLINEVLNANSFQNNASALPRAPFKEHQFGFSLGGPLRRERIFAFLALEAQQARSLSAPREAILPSPSMRQRASGTMARTLLERFPPRFGNCPLLDADRVTCEVSLPQNVGAISSTGRIDLDSSDGKSRSLLRFSSFDQNYDPLSGSVYRDLSIPFRTHSTNFAIGQVHRLSGNAVAEAKFGWNQNDYDHLPRETALPDLFSSDRTLLPGTPALIPDQIYQDRLFHVLGNVSLLLARHQLVVGGEYLPSIGDSRFEPGRRGRYFFSSVADFASDRPQSLETAVDRFSTGEYRQPNFAKQFRMHEWALFIQNNWRVRPRLTVNVGLRYERFGVPHSSEPREDLNYYPGPGSTAAERIGAGQLRRASENPEFRNRLYRADSNNFAPRTGIAFDLFGNSRTILRGGYGIYFDRLFNLLWDRLRQNTYVSVTLSRPFQPIRYVFPAFDGLPATPAAIAPRPALSIDAGLRTPFVQTWFLGVQQSWGRNTLWEVNHVGSLGRRLVTQDVVNRFSLLNPAIGEIQAITNQGRSSYLSLQTRVFRRMSRGLQFLASYTWSHAIDNQGDPLIVPQAQQRAFQVQFDSQGDRGNADFDQRHNLVWHAIWETPRAPRRLLGALLSGWQIAAIAGYRSGFPLTVVARSQGFLSNEGPVMQPRADYLGGPVPPPNQRGVAGGKYVLDPSRFADPFLVSGTARLGNSGRGAFRGPGFWNYDFSIGREFRLSGLGETGRLQIRAAFFNVFNHANLGVPDTRLDSPFFGQARFGRLGAESLASGSNALDEFARRVQFGLRVRF